MEQRCSECGGRGYNDCPRCKGQGGSVIIPGVGPRGECPDCRGEGILDCDECDGTGKVDDGEEEEHYY